MNAIELLEDDHYKVEKLFHEIKSTEDVAVHREVFKEIKNELELHAHIEETIFYPEIIQQEQLKDIVMEGIEEHLQVKNLLNELSIPSLQEDLFKAKLKVLIEDVEHHVKEEEEEMFPTVEELFSEDELKQLGNKMNAEKLKLST